MVDNSPRGYLYTARNFDFANQTVRVELIDINSNEILDEVSYENVED